MIERATDVATALWKRFRATRAFLPSLVLVPALIVALTGWGMYASWDSTRVDIPNTVGLTLPEGEEAMRGLGVSLTAIEVLDDAIAESCYVVSSQSLEPGTRVVPEDTTVELGVELSVREVASVVDMSLAQATSKLLEGCLHASVSTTWCLPDDFSGTDESLESPAFTPETGFRFDSVTRQLRHSSLVAVESWIVCDQSIRAATEAEAGSTVELSLYPRLTTVPAVGGNVSDVVSALDMTADACTLSPKFRAIFPADPSAVASKRIPSITTIGHWEVASVAPDVGHAVLCDSQVEVEVVWPEATMPRLLGLRHVPETTGSETPTTAALIAAGLVASCSGTGTVTTQVPKPGTPVPVGTAVTCVAERVVPNIVGLDLDAAESVLKAAGIEGGCYGSGVVKNQSIKPGAVVSGSDSISCEAEERRAAAPRDVYYKNCSAARAAGAAPIYRGQPGYRPALDRDNDGIACE